MTTLDFLVVDCVTPFRDWLRAADLTSIGESWYAGKLPQHPPALAGRVSRVGGRLLEPSIDRALLQVDVFGDGTIGGDTVANVSAAVFSLCESAQRVSLIPSLWSGATIPDPSAPSLLLLGARVIADLDSPALNTGHPRRVLTIEATTLAIPAN